MAAGTKHKEARINWERVVWQLQYSCCILEALTSSLSPIAHIIKWKKEVTVEIATKVVSS